MNSLAIISTAIASELGPVDQKPEFRKATEKMKSCGGVAELCLSRLPESLRTELKAGEYQKLCTILGTSLGEIQVTREFLETLDREGMARPILFQNSLHNAVGGFITLYLGLKGPAVTVSNRFFTAENAIDTANLLMNEEQPFALVICGEIVVPDFLPGYSKIYPPGIKLTSGAAAVFLTSEAKANSYGLSPLGWIEKLEYQDHGTVLATNSFYDARLEKIIGSGLSKQVLTLPKPNGSFSQVTFS